MVEKVGPPDKDFGGPFVDMAQKRNGVGTISASVLYPLYQQDPPGIHEKNFFFHKNQHLTSNTHENSNNYLQPTYS